MIVLKNLAKEYNIDPYKLRQKLRNKFGEAPEGRWRWPPSSPQLKKIKEFLDHDKLKRNSLSERTKEHG